MLFDKPRELAPGDVLRWLNVCNSGVALEEENVRRPLAEGGGKARVGAYFSACRRELQLAAVFTLIAAAEGRIRLDAQTRSQQMADSLSRRLTVLRAKVRFPWQVPLYDHGIIDAWKMYIGSLATIPQPERVRLLTDIGQLSNLLAIRHWVAHGRYWSLQRKADHYSAPVVAEIVSKLYGALRKAADYGGATRFS